MLNGRQQPVDSDLITKCVQLVRKDVQGVDMPHIRFFLCMASGFKTEYFQKLTDVNFFLCGCISTNLLDCLSTMQLC